MGNENVNVDFLPQIPLLGAWKSVFSRCGTRGLCVPSKKHAVSRLELWAGVRRWPGKIR